MTTPSSTHDGPILSVDGDKFTSKSTDGRTHQHTVATVAKVTCDGKACEMAVLKAGTPALVTSEQTAPTVATAVECGKRVAGPAAVETA